MNEKQFLEEVIENISNFWWTENDAIHKMESRMGANDSDHVIFKVSDDGSRCTMEITVFHGSSFKRLAEKTYSSVTEEGKLINSVYKTSRIHLMAISKDEETSQIHRYHELVENSNQIIRKYF